MAQQNATPDKVGTYRLTARSALSEFGLRSTSLSDSVLFAISSKESSHSWFTRERIQNSNCYFGCQPADTSKSPQASPARSRGLSSLPICPLVNFAMIKHMLEFCSNHHTGTCQGATTPLELPGFHVLDCENANLVPWGTLTDGRPTYLTLSYVWGSVAEPSSTDPNTPFGKEAPHLIRDAMELTKRLGYKYLWIDRYCIPQDDMAAKLIQIRHMNEIYAKSALTIIAAAGSNPRDGVPGISVERHQQESVVLGNWRLTQITTNIVPEIQSSVWNSRGWTYQEGLLSSRKLAFSNNQWYFQCSGMWSMEVFAHALEDMHAKDQPHFPLPQPFSPSLPIAFPYRGVGVRMNGDDVWKRIQEFWTRKLSFQNDALDAFSGILTAFETYSGRRYRQSLYYWGHICGLPVMSASDVSSKAAVIHSLCWSISSLSSPLKRRVSFPSWTWLGWEFLGLPEKHWGPCPLGATSPSRIRVFKATDFSLHFDDRPPLTWPEDGYMCKDGLVEIPRNLTPRWIRARGWISELWFPKDGPAPFDGETARGPPLLLGLMEIPFDEFANFCRQARQMDWPEEGDQSGRFIKYWIMSWGVPWAKSRAAINSLHALALKPTSEPDTFERLGRLQRETSLIDIGKELGQNRLGEHELAERFGWQLCEFWIQ